MRAFAFGALAALLLAGSASAANDQGGTLTTKEKPARSTLIFDGAAWKCEENDCRAVTVKAVPAERACRQLVGKLGELTAFTYRGQAFTAEALANCNAAAKR